jgi:cytochrome c peroxidase
MARASLGPRRLLALAATLALAACGGGSASTTDTTGGTSTGSGGVTDLPALRVSVGETLFHDAGLSASGRLSCASCHVAADGHADAAGVFLPLGGVALDQQGLRSSPSLRYLDTVPPFTIDGAGAAHGGLFWDGRADTRAAQTAGPLFGAAEMANTDAASLATKVRASTAFADLATAYALAADADDASVVAALQQALAAYQAGDEEFHPYSSKFDAVQAGMAQFDAAEARGRAVFDDPQRGNCAACHPSRPGPGQTQALFTNFGYFALGVPRNTSDATADPAFFDLGLCGPKRLDLAADATQCGRFRVPTLRNVALTAPYFHNARFTTLGDVVGFYATRDSDPGRWYPTVAGVVQKFDDLPAAYQGNVRQGPPFNRPGDARPVLTAGDVADLVAFLQTLTDGYVP